MFNLKGQSNEILDTQFFSSFEPAWATDQWVNIVSFLGLVFAEILEFFRSSVQYHTTRSQVLRSIILRGVKWLFCILFKGSDDLCLLFCIDPYSLAGPYEGCLPDGLHPRSGWWGDRQRGRQHPSRRPSAHRQRRQLSTQLVIRGDRRDILHYS